MECRDVENNGIEVFNKLVEKLAREHGVKLEDCEDVDLEVGLFACHKINGRTAFAEADLSAVGITETKCVACLNVQVIEDEGGD